MGIPHHSNLQSSSYGVPLPVSVELCPALHFKLPCVHTCYQVLADVTSDDAWRHALSTMGRPRLLWSLRGSLESSNWSSTRYTWSRLASQLHYLKRHESVPPRWFGRRFPCLVNGYLGRQCSASRVEHRYLIISQLYRIRDNKLTQKGRMAPYSVHVRYACRYDGPSPPLQPLTHR